jgi:hypothetical protein
MIYDNLPRQPNLGEVPVRFGRGRREEERGTMQGKEKGRRRALAYSVRRIGFGGVIATAIALMVLLAPTVSASSSSVKNLKAPYKGSVSSSETIDFQGCGGTASVAQPPFFNLTTGQAFLIAQANSTSCGKTNSSAAVYAEPEYSSKVLAIPTGPGSIRELWTVSLSIHLVATPGVSGHAFAVAQVYLFSYVYDSTTDTFIDTTAASSYYHSISSGSVTKTLSGIKFVDYLNGTFAAGDSYYLYAAIGIEAYAETSTGHAVAGAYVNAGVSGKFADLTSITLP